MTLKPVKKYACVVCGQELIIAWTDTRGIGSCRTCELPYVIYYYDRKEAPVELKPGSVPAPALTKHGLGLAIKHWKENKTIAFRKIYDHEYWRYMMGTKVGIKALNAELAHAQAVIKVQGRVK